MTFQALLIQLFSLPDVVLFKNVEKKKDKSCLFRTQQRSAVMFPSSDLPSLLTANVELGEGGRCATFVMTENRNVNHGVAAAHKTSSHSHGCYMSYKNKSKSSHQNDPKTL